MLFNYTVQILVLVMHDGDISDQKKSKGGKFSSVSQSSFSSSYKM